MFCVASRTSKTLKLCFLFVRLLETWRTCRETSSKMIHHFMKYYCLKKRKMKKTEFIFVHRDGILWMRFYLEKRTWSCNIFWLILSLIYFKIFFSNFQWEKKSFLVFYSAWNSIKKNLQNEPSSIEICFAMPSLLLSWKLYHKKLSVKLARCTPFFIGLLFPENHKTSNWIYGWGLKNNSILPPASTVKRPALMTLHKSHTEYISHWFCSVTQRDSQSKISWT